MYNLQYSKTDPRAISLWFSKPGAATMDLHALLEPGRNIDPSHNFTDIRPGEWRRVRTGIAIQIPLGYEAQIRTCHHLAESMGIVVMNSPGTVPRCCTSELYVLLRNHNHRSITIEDGQKIALLAIVPVGEFVPYLVPVQLGNVATLTQQQGPIGTIGPDDRGFGVSTKDAA